MNVPADSNILEGKVVLLEKTLNAFRAEMDMKMRIMERILTTRNGIYQAT